MGLGRRVADAMGRPGARTAARWTVTLAMVAGLVLLVDVGAALEVLLSLAPLPFAAALLLALSDRALMIGKWLPLARVLTPGLTTLRGAKAYLAASFASLFLPSSVGGDAVRAYALGRDDGQVTEVAVSIFVERVLGFLALCVVVGAALAVAAGRVDGTGRYLWGVGAIAAATVAVLAVPLLREGRGETAVSEAEGWRGRLSRLRVRCMAAYRAYRGHPRRLLAVGGLSVIEQMFPVGLIALLAVALDVPVGFVGIFVATPIAILVTRMPIAIDGIGVAEGAFVYMLGLFGVPPEEALALALAKRVVTTLAVLPGAFFLSGLPAPSRPPASSASPPEPESATATEPASGRGEPARKGRRTG